VGHESIIKSLEVCVVCVCLCALHAGPDVFVPAEPVGRSRCELGWMKINRSSAGHREEG